MPLPFFELTEDVRGGCRARAFYEERIKMARLQFNYKKELKKLKNIADFMPEDRKKICEGLLTDAAFMAERLEELREHIKENGWSEEYQNGENQRGRKITVEADCYLKTQKLYAATIKQLVDQLPPPTETAAGTDIMKFLSGNE